MLKIISNVCSVIGKIVSALYFDYKIGGGWIFQSADFSVTLHMSGLECLTV